MIQNRDDADVGRSVRAFRSYVQAIRRCLDRHHARLVPLLPVAREGGAQSKAIAGPLVARIERKIEAARADLRFWTEAVDRLLAVHAEHKARMPWGVPIAHDPTGDERQGICV